MTSSKPCGVIIFNFINFDKREGEREDLPKRDASLKDVKRLQRLCQALNLPEMLVSDLTLSELKAKLKFFSKYNFEEYGALLLVFMSHGTERNVLYCKDGQFDYEDALKTIYKNKTLHNKPVFIIIQACKGEFNVMEAYDSASASAGTLPENLVVITSSMEGFQTYLNRATGSRFIEKIVDVISKNWTEKSVQHMFKTSIELYNMEESAQQGFIRIHGFIYSSLDDIKYKFADTN